MVKSSATPRLKLERESGSSVKLAKREMPRRLSSPIVQSKTATFTDSGSVSVTFDNPVGSGNILVAFCLLSVFNEPFIPTDNQGNEWVEPAELLDVLSPAWYALNAKAGTTTVTFPGFSIFDPGTWVIILEIAGPWNRYDTFAINVNDPPVEESVPLTTTANGDIIIALFAGESDSGEPPSQWTAGVESTEIFNDVVAYTTDDSWGVIVEYQIAGEAGDTESTATFDDGVGVFSFGMAIAFKGVMPVPGEFRIGPLSMSNFVPYSV